MKFILTFLAISLYSTITLAQCTITEIFATVVNCDDTDRFDVTLAFDYLETSDSFEVIGNGQNYGTFAYAELPITIEELLGDCNTDYEFIVRDSANPSCSNFTGIGTVCCGAECSIEATISSLSGCTPDNMVNFVLDVEADVANMDDFTVYGGQIFFQVYDYDDLPAVVIEFPTGTSAVSTVVVCDNSPTGGCCDTLSFENPCICSIFNTESEIVDCDPETDTYHVTIDFDYNMTSDSFVLGGNSVFIGNFAYADLPLTVGPFLFDDEEDLEFLVVDQVSNLCFNGIPVGIVDDCNFDCEITSIFAEVYNCNDGFYSIDVEFEADNASVGDQYLVSVNNDFADTLAYGETFYTLEEIELNCEGPAFIQIFGPEGCVASYTVEDISCCICPWKYFTAHTFCEGNEVLFTFTYDINLMEAEDFYIEVAGLVFGPYVYLEYDTISLGSFENGTYVMTMFQEGDGCSTPTDFVVNCITPVCDINDVFYEWYEECDGNLASMDLQVEGIGLSDSFEVSLNSVVLGNFSYNPTFITLEGIELDCNSDYELRIQNLGPENCVAEVILEDLPCCDTLVCDIRDITAQTTCIDEGITVVLNFIFENPTSAQYNLRVGSTDIGNFFYADLPLEFTIDSDDWGEIRIADLEAESCVGELEIFPGCNCELENLTAEFAYCVDTAFALIFSLEYAGVSPDATFTLRGNGIVYGTYNYADLPITLRSLEPNNGLEYEFIAINDENDDCTTALEFGEVDCTTSTEDLSDVDWSVYMKDQSVSITHDLDQALINIYDINGQLISTTESIKSTNIDLQSVPTGIYVVNLITQSGVTASKKIVKL